MGRNIELTVKDKIYNLEFNRRTLLIASDVQEKIKKAETNAEKYDAVIELVRCSFLKNHPNVSQEEIETIVDSIDDLESFIEAITVIMKDSVDVLNSSKGNAHWEVKK